MSSESVHPFGPFPAGRSFLVIEAVTIAATVVVASLF
jgi:hypothetical protein